MVLRSSSVWDRNPICALIKTGIIPKIKLLRHIINPTKFINLTEGKESWERCVHFLHKDVGSCIFLEKPVKPTKPGGMQIQGERWLSGKVDEKSGLVLEKEYLTGSFKNCQPGLRGYPRGSKSLIITSRLLACSSHLPMWHLSLCASRNDTKGSVLGTVKVKLLPFVGKSDISVSLLCERCVSLGDSTRLFHLWEVPCSDVSGSFLSSQFLFQTFSILLNSSSGFLKGMILSCGEGSPKGLWQRTWSGKRVPFVIIHSPSTKASFSWQSLWMPSSPILVFRITARFAPPPALLPHVGSLGGFFVDSWETNFPYLFRTHVNLKFL